MRAGQLQAASNQAWTKVPWNCSPQQDMSKIGQPMTENYRWWKMRAMHQWGACAISSSRGYGREKLTLIRLNPGLAT